MARLIQTGDTPAKRRHAHMRSCAEVLRLLAQRPTFDEEAKDMAAFLVFNLRDIYQIIDESAQTWDEKGYWRKAEKLRDDWRWAHLAAQELDGMIRQQQWHGLPMKLIELVPHFSGVTVTTITRDADWWCGALRALLREKSS